MRKFIEAHTDDILKYFDKKSSDIDIMFLSRIINLQDKLEQVFDDNAKNIG